MSIPARQYFSIYAVLLAVAVAPVWLTAQPPLVDYPNHLARMYVLLNLPHSEVLQRFYQTDWAILPNLAMDLVIPPLAAVMPLEAAGKTFISLTLFLLSIGPVMLYRAWHGRWSAWPFAAFLFLYNRIFLYGFLNYLFGLGLALCTLAAWIHFRDRSWILRAWVFSILATVLFFAHLGALGVYALCVFGYEIGRRNREPLPGMGKDGWLEAAGSAVQFVVPAILFFLSPTVHGASGQDYGSPAMNFLVGLVVKLVSLFFGVYNYNLFLDGLTFLACVVFGAMALASGKLILRRDAYWILGSVAAALLLVPFRSLSANFADARLSVALLFLSIGMTDLRLHETWWRRALAVGFLGLFVVRLDVLQSHWRAFEKPFGEYMQALDKLPEGAKLFTAMADPDGSKSMSPMYHLSCMAVIRRSAFVPSLYAFPFAQPIALTPEYRSLARQTPGPDFIGKAAPPWQALSGKYDYLLVMDEQQLKGHLPENLGLVYRGKDIRLYRVRQSS
jgi:hypothetical protein